MVSLRLTWNFLPWMSLGQWLKSMVLRRRDHFISLQMRVIGLKLGVRQDACSIYSVVSWRIQIKYKLRLC